MTSINETFGVSNERHALVMEKIEPIFDEFDNGTIHTGACLAKVAALQDTYANDNERHAALITIAFNLQRIRDERKIGNLLKVTRDIATTTLLREE